MLFSTKQYKICILGLDNAGKTTILYKLLTGSGLDTTPTIGSNVEELKYKNIHCVLWDIGGQESLRSSWSTYYTNAKAVILVVDCTDPQRNRIVAEELNNILNNDLLKGAVLLVFANKQDVSGALGPAELSSELHLTEIRNRYWHIQFAFY